jgi:hypothetical protein
MRSHTEANLPPSLKRVDALMSLPMIDSINELRDFW